MQTEIVRKKLLTWYANHRRRLPWRETSDPYAIWVSEVMLQQTTVAAVRDYFQRFTDRWLNVGALAAAEDAEVMGEWAGLGYYARARNLLKCARVVVDDHSGVFPDTRDELLKLPGIGPYTAAAIAAIAFEEPAAVVDGNVERVLSRVFRVETPLPRAKPELTKLAARLTPDDRPGDYAQAVMDLGATVCSPRSPACGICPLIDVCQARAAGQQADLPRKAPKTSKPVRLGIAYVARREDGAWLLETRAETGLLGGMLGWPGSDWSDAPQEAPPIPADWHRIDAEVRHTFTHFHLRLAVLVANVGNVPPGRGHFLPHRDFRPSDLPTVMRKIYDVAKHEFDGN